MPTIRDVAKLAGVAPITVSRVVNKTGYISSETRIRVEQAIEALHYVPNSLSRSLRSKKTGKIIAFIVSDITNPFWTTVARGIEDASSKSGLNVILCNTDENPDKQDDYVNVLLQKQTDGFLLVPARETPTVVQKIQKQQVPLVLIDREVKDAAVDIVRSDSFRGAYELTQYLISLGHRRIAMLSGAESISTGRLRVAGYAQAMRDARLPLDPALIYFGEFKQEWGMKIAYQILDRVTPLPTALVGGNNFIALGVLRALHVRGVRVPDDLSVVGFDDLLNYAVTDPWLTVAAQEPYVLGFRAARLLIAFISGDEQPGSRDIMLPVELRIRQSCRRIST